MRKEGVRVAPRLVQSCWQDGAAMHREGRTEWGVGWEGEALRVVQEFGFGCDLNEVSVKHPRGVSRRWLEILGGGAISATSISVDTLERRAGNALGSVRTVTWGSPSWPTLWPLLCITLWEPLFLNPGPGLHIRRWQLCPPPLG